MALLGALNEWNSSEEEWSNYIERVHFYFEANDIADESKKRAILLSVVGPRNYSVLRGLADNQPEEKTFDELAELMKRHLKPAPNVIHERFMFNTRDKKEGESINEYVAVLRKMSEHCDFQDKVSECIRDRLVVGLKDSKIQERLLSERNLTLNQAIEIAVSIESARKYTKLMQEPIIEGFNSVHKLPVKRECFRCGSLYHTADKCSFINSECFKCHRIGHTRRMCRQQQTRYPKIAAKGRSVNRVEGASASEGDWGMERLSLEEKETSQERLTLYNVTNLRTPPVMVELLINKSKVLLEVDTGASCTVMGLNKFKELGKLQDLKENELKLTTYTGEVVRPKGMTEVEVIHKGKLWHLPLLVVNGEVPTLLGRNWMKQLYSNWETMFSLKEEETSTKLKQLLEEQSELFDGKMGCLKDFKVKIPISKYAEPKFCKARPVPYALKEEVEKELDRLEAQGIYKRVEYARWAAPIVPVAKNTGGIRICGDYKQTINAAAPCVNYPIPKTEDIFATLRGGQKFTKLDLSHAYQQLELDEEAQELLTVNTPRGLYQPTRLQFGVHSATGIFQKEMDKRLKDIPFCKVRVDDILISGSDDSSHLRNLKKVLEVLSEAGLKLKKSKCEFLLHEITYLGFRLSKEGIAPLPEKVEAMTKAPSPKNVTELKAYLGAVNYYHNHLPNLSSLLEPLHELLRKGAVWKWEGGQQKAFEETKKMLGSAPLLVHFDPSKPILVQVDASPYGLEVILAHRMEDGSERPVCYISRTLSEAERNYAHIEKEGLAIVFAVKRLHQYLFGNKFTIFTDHKPLLGLFAEYKPIPALAAARIQRWALFLAGYDYKLEYRAGSLNGNADFLSRLPLKAQKEDISQAVNQVHMMNLVEAPVNVATVRGETRRDPVLSHVCQNILNGWSNSCVSEEMGPYFSRKEELTCEEGVILWGSRIVIPPKLRLRVLQQLHQTHIGIVRMKALARSYVWWPKLDKDIEKAAKECGICLLEQKLPNKAPIHCWEHPSQPWERVHIDYAGPFLGHMFLIVVDAYSKWMEIGILRTSTAAATIEKLRGIFAMHGLPALVVSDNGPCFSSGEFRSFLKANGVRHLYTAPYHPSSNGQAERCVRTFKEAIRKMSQDEKTTLETKVNRFLFTFRITPHTATGIAPAELIFKRQLRTAFHLLRPDKHRMCEYQSKLEKGSKIGTPLREFAVRDPVLVQNYGQGRRWVEGTITRQLGRVNYEVETEGGMTKRHVDQIVKRPNLGEDERTASEVNLEEEHENVDASMTGEGDSEPNVGGMTEAGLGAGETGQWTEPELRRSRRVCKTPIKLKDYVCS